MIYQIIEASSGTELAAKVNKELQGGWELSGGVSVCVSQSLGRKTVYAQSMTKAA